MFMRIISTIIFIILLSTSLFAELQKPTPDIKPEDVIKKISQILNNQKSVRERKKNAYQLLSSFDDPYKILLKAIQKIKF